MAGRSASSRKWIAGALHAGRAAAFLTIAVGLNGALAAILPRDQSIYVYLLVVIVVSALSNVFISLLTAVAAVAVYGWMTAPGHLPSAPVIVAFVMAALVTMATRAAIQIKRPAIAVPVEPPLLPPHERPAAVEYVVDDERVKQLTDQLEAARQMLERESRSRAEAAASARQRENDLENQIEALRERAADQGNRSLNARRELDALTKRLSEAETRAVALQQGIETAQKKADQEHARAEREAKLREQLEVAGHESLQKTVADLSAKHEAAMLESKQRAEVAARKLEIVQKELREERARTEREATMRAQNENAGTERLQKTIVELTQKHEAAAADAQKRAESTTAKINALQRELDRTLASLADEHARADREAKLRGQLEAAARETLHRTADVAADHQRDAVAAREAAAAAGERAEALENELNHLREELAAVQRGRDEQRQLHESSEQRIAEMQQQIDELRAAAERQREESDMAFQQYASAAEQERASFHSELEAARHAADHERLRADLEAASRGKLAEELAAARQEIDALASRSRESDEAGKTALQEELQAANQKLQELMTVKSELELARTVVENERKRSAQLQAEREKLTRDFDANLQSIVTGMTTDHENAIGDLLVEKSTAKAEIRTLNQKLQDLQRVLEEERSRSAQHKSALDKIEAEWSAKLQKIVTHLTEDHEADVGDAMLAKEAARAEARTLSAKVTLLHQRIEEERERFRQAAERWQQERASLMSRRGAYPATVEQAMPQVEPVKAATVLIVHSDAGVRAMSKHSLQQAGYTVLTAADGLEGLRTATQQKPDVVLAEAVMPKMNARELVQLLKSRPETAEVKIILLSGASGQPAERGTDFRADDVVHNPGDANGLRAALANVLSRRVAS